MAAVLLAGLAAVSVLGQGNPADVFAGSAAGGSAGGTAGGGGGGGGAVTGGSGGSGGGLQFLPAPPAGEPQMLFRSVMADDSPANDSSWLGVAVSDTTEPLSAQLGLKHGEGLVVTLVASNSPAAVAGLQKNDVLVELDGQMLVDPIQLRKLVQMRADGDTVKIEYYRAGRRESVSAKLTKMPADERMGDAGANPYGQFYQRLQAVMPAIQKVDTVRINEQVRRAMADAERAMQDAVRQSQEAGNLNRRLQVLQQKLGNLAAGGVNLNQDATVMVKNDTGAVRTVVKKDETGTYILVADPAKHATVHDGNDKLLFDGPIDSPDQQKKVPAEVWKKIAPLIQQLDQDSPPNPPEPPAAPEPPQD